METPLVSVIIPAYNAALYLEECLNSVLSQTYQNLEIIIVDDGSTDRQKEVIYTYLTKFENVHYHYQQNRGVAAARNKGLEFAKGEYIAFLDADDVWLENNLSLKVQRFGEGDFGLVHSGAYLIDANSDLIEGQLVGKEGNLLNDMLAWKSTLVPGPSSILVKCDVIEKVGFWDENLSTSADQDFFIRIASQFKIGRVPELSWKYRIHSQNMHKNIKVMETDVLYTFHKARRNNLFYSKSFERKCFANVYLILAASWAGDGRNLLRGMIFCWKSVFTQPLVIIKVTKIISTKLFSIIKTPHYGS